MQVRDEGLAKRYGVKALEWLINRIMKPDGEKRNLRTKGIWRRENARLRARRMRIEMSFRGFPSGKICV